MIARRELTSQGAKAGRMLLDAFLANPARERFGIQGYGPERAIYEAVYRSTGLHRQTSRLGTGSSPSQRSGTGERCGQNSKQACRKRQDRRINLAEIAERLKRPPIGLKDGILPILLVSALTAHGDEVALYEHGSLVLRLDDAVAERLARNPGHFTVKNNATHPAAESSSWTAIAERLGLISGTAQPTFLHVARALYRELQSLPPFTQQTRRTSPQRAVAVLQAFKTAAEPDSLIFETLPVLLGLPGFAAADSCAQRRTLTPSLSL